MNSVSTSSQGFYPRGSRGSLSTCKSLNLFAFCGLSPCFRPTKTKTTEKTDQLFEYNFRSLANGKGFLCFYNLT